MLLAPAAKCASLPPFPQVSAARDPPPPGSALAGERGKGRAASAAAQALAGDRAGGQPAGITRGMVA